MRTKSSDNLSGMVREMLVCASVAIAVLALAIVALIKFIPAPSSQPFTSALPPAETQPATRARSERFARFLLSRAPRPEIGLGAAVEIASAAQLGAADGRMGAAGASISHLCRTVHYCAARRLYVHVGDSLASLAPCSTLCAEMALKAQAGQAEAGARIALAAELIGCGAGKDVCACLAQRGHDCQSSRRPGR